MQKFPFDYYNLDLMNKSVNGIMMLPPRKCKSFLLPYPVIITVPRTIYFFQGCHERLI